MLKKTIMNIAILNCFVLFVVFLEMFTVEEFQMSFDMNFYFGSVVNSSIFLIGILVIVIFFIAIIFLFKLNLKVFLGIYLISLILFIVRIVIITITTYQFTIFNIVASSIIAVVKLSTFAFILYFKLKLGFSEELKIFERSKLEKILRVSEKINLEIMRNILELDQKIFQEKVIDYSKQFGMTVEGNNLIIKKENLDDFLNSLENQFKEWETNDKFKAKKR